MKKLLVTHGFRPISRAQVIPSVTGRFTTNHQSRQYAHQSYGDGEGDPKGENPQEQGSNPSAEKEHPGPPPPAEGQGSGGGPTKADESGHNTQDNASSPSKEGDGRGSKEHGSRRSKSGAQPKILDEAEPTAQNDEVKQHNEEMTNRYDRAGTQVGNPEQDKVGKGFWSGEVFTHPAF